MQTPDRQGQLCLYAALFLSVVSAAVALPTDSTENYWGTDGWVDARATNYGADAWPVHGGECGFGFICPNRWSSQLQNSLDVVAVTDAGLSQLQGIYRAGGRFGKNQKCGQCLEIKCRNAEIKDKDANDRSGMIDRSGLCLNKKVVKVKIADLCQCNYAPNAASNKRWCCGDEQHLDVSIFALEKIVKEVGRWGVFAISYRKVDCNTPTVDEAPPIARPTRDPHTNMKPPGLNCGRTTQSRSLSPPRKAISNKSKMSSDSKGSSDKDQVSRWWKSFHELPRRTQRMFYNKLWDRIQSGDKAVENSRDGDGNNIGKQYYN